MSSNYQFVFPIQSDFYISFDDSYSEYLTVNFFQLNGNKGLIIDEHNNQYTFNTLNVDWSSINAGFDIGNNCVSFINKFYPKNKITFLTARTATLDSSNKVNPDYFLFFGLK